MKIIRIISILLILATTHIFAQYIPYGQNIKTGNYFNTGDANIYYEIYGEGKPVILVHSGFGYIDSFKKYIPILAKEYKVIAIATRGYGKSEIGNQAFSFDLLANDIQKIIKESCDEKAIIMGHSDGAMLAYLVAHKFPSIVSKVVAMGGPLGTIGYGEDGLEWLKNYTIKEFESYRPDLKTIMSQPERWTELSDKLKEMWTTAQILELSELREITCPVLLLFGDRDLFCTTDHIVQIYKNLPNAQLAIFPNSGHSDISYRNIQILKQNIIPFIIE